jgi:hypothetical protein
MEWSDTSTVMAVSGTGTSLIVHALPASLSSAIDNGNKPRLAIVLTSPIPFVSRVTAYVVDTPMAGQHTLTLETSLPSSPASKRVHPAGSATVPVAAAILSTIDGLGPSRSSGMADAIFDRSGDSVCEVRAWSSTAWRRTRVTDEANASLIATYRTAAPELAREVQRLQAAAEDRERQHKAALDTLRMERDHARMRVDRDCARLADEVAALVRLKVIDERSPAADAHRARRGGLRDLAPANRNGRVDGPGG